MKERFYELYKILKKDRELSPWSKEGTLMSRCEQLASEVEEIREAILNRIDQLKIKGFKVREISLPHSPYCIADYYIVANAEASSNLSRYDGARYGFRNRDAGNLQEMYTNSRTEGFGTEVKRRIMLGTYALSSGYYDAYYQKARKVRYLIKEDFDNAFRSVDCIITPTSPTTAR